MTPTDPSSVSWLAVLLPSLLVGAITYIATSISFKASSTEKSKAHDDKLADLKKEVDKKADIESLKGVWEEMKRIDKAKAEKDVVSMLIQQLQSIDTKVTQILSKLSD